MNVRACIAAASFALVSTVGTQAGAQSLHFRSTPFVDVAGIATAGGWLAAPPTAGTTIDLSSGARAASWRHPRAQRGAQAACDQTQARALFDQGVAAADRLEWPDAATAFQRSYELCHESRALRNLGLAHRALGQYTRSIRELEQFLAEGSPEADVRTLVEQALTEMRGNVSTLTITPSVSGASVVLDGQQVAPGEPQQVDPGNHLVLVTAQGYQRNGQSITLGQHETRDLPVRLEHQGGVSVAAIVLTIVGTLAVAGGVVAIVLLTSHEAAPDCGSLMVCIQPM